MSKDTLKDKDKEYLEHLDDSKVLNVEVEKNELKKSFIAYAMAVNVSRAIPDVRDGLKPVHRRILYAMNELNLTPDKPYRKSAMVVGEVLGKYHPHGDSSVYDAMVRLAQDFSIRCPLVDGHGNFGSVDGDPPAAYRYTEALEMIRDIDKRTVDFYPNFDDTREQPVVLPSRFPNLLVNGSDGIAVGMATSIPPHNLGEVIDAVVALMRNPELTVDDLMEYIPAPDYPTAGLVLGRAAIRQAYRTGKGAAVIRSRTEIEELPGGKSRIIITELPYQVNKAKLIENIADQVKDKRIEGISDISEETDRTGMRIVIDVKKDHNPQVVLNTLFKQTSLQVNNSIILLALVDGTPRILNLKQILEYYIAHQEDVIVRRTRFDLEKAEEREHILNGLVIALANIDEVVELLKKSADRQDAIDKLTERFLLSEKQAVAILEMRLQRLTGLEVEKLNEELAEKRAEIEEYKRILASEDAVKELIVKEITEIKERYATPRRSELSYDYSEINIADLIDKEDIVVSMTHGGYIKRLPVSEYRSQRRGGMGVTAHKAKDDDFVEHIFVSNTHQDMLFFTNLGKAYTMMGYEIPEASKTSRGRALVNLLQLSPGEKVQTVLPLPEEREGKFLMLATKRGLIKKTPLDEFASIKRNGKIAIKFMEEDELIEAVLTSGDDQLIMASSEGYCIRPRRRHRGLRDPHHHHPRLRQAQQRGRLPPAGQSGQRRQSRRVQREDGRPRGAQSHPRGYGRHDDHGRRHHHPRPGGRDLQDRTRHPGRAHHEAERRGDQGGRHRAHSPRGRGARGRDRGRRGGGRSSRGRGSRDLSRQRSRRRHDSPCGSSPRRGAITPARRSKPPQNKLYPTQNAR